MIEELLLNPTSSGAIAYALLFLALMGGSIGLPIPEDVPLIAAGVLAHRGQVRPDLVFVVCYIAIILGDLVIYSAGRYFGPGLLKNRWIARSVSEDRVGRVRVQLERRSLIMIFLARHLFYIRTVTFLACGVVRMNFLRFLIADVISALISVPLMMGIGYLFSENLDVILNAVQESRFYIFLAVMGGAGVLLGSWLKRRSKHGTPSYETAVSADVAPPMAEGGVPRRVHPDRRPATDGVTARSATGDGHRNGTVRLHSEKPHEQNGSSLLNRHASLAADDQ